MGDNQNLLFAIPRVFLCLLGIYLIALFVLRFIFKIKRDYTVAAKVQKVLPKWFRYSYIVLFIGAILVYCIWEMSYGLLLLLMLVNQGIIAKVALGIIQDKKQKYYQYWTIIFSLTGIISISLIGILSII